ncbi:hypothetical protein LINGRAHAP2_LOCUS18188 [Linum grandiflorum]
MDFLCAVSSILSIQSEDCKHTHCIRAIQSLLRRDWVVTITHILREGNRVADLLAHQGHSTHFLAFQLR